MWDDLKVTSNGKCARGTQSHAKMDMRVQRCAGKKFHLPVALGVPLFVILQIKYTFSNCAMTVDATQHCASSAE